MSKRLLILLFVCAGILGAAAQEDSVHLHGTILDAQTHEPLAQVWVSLLETSHSAVTENDGGFHFTQLKPGLYHLQVMRPGFALERLVLAVYSDTTVAIELSAQGLLISEVEVNSERENSISIPVLGALAIDANFEKTISGLMEQMPSVSQVRNGSDIGLPVVHGLSGNRMTLVNNGVVHNGQQWGMDHSPEIDVNSAGNISLLSGAGTLRYPGTHMGGVVVLAPNPIPFDPHLHGKVRSTLESNGRGGTVNVQVYKGMEQFQWRLGGTLKRYGDRSAPSYFLNNTGTRQVHWNADVHRQWRENLELSVFYNLFSADYGILRGSQVANITDLLGAFDREVPFFTEEVHSYEIGAPRQNVLHQQIKTTLRKDWEGHVLEWNVAGQRNQRREFDVRRSGRSDIPALSLLQYSMQSEWIWKAPRNWEAGYQFHGKNNWNIAETGILPLLPNYTSFTNGAYLIFTQNGYRTDVEFAARYDYVGRKASVLTSSVPREVVYFEDGFHNLSVLARATTSLSPSWKIMGELALRQRPPEINELYAFGLHQGVSSIEEGNPTLQRETGYKATAQLRGKLGRLQVDVKVYAHGFNGYIYLKPEEELRLTIRGAFPVFTYAQCDARLLGGDATLDYPLSPHWKVHATWSYVHGSNLTDGLPLNFMPPLNGRHTLSYAHRENANGTSWSAQVTHRYVARQGHWDPSLDLTPPPPAYHLFEAQMKLTLNRWKNKPELRLALHNALNTPYRDYLNRLRYFSDDMGRNISLSWVQNF